MFLRRLTVCSAFLTGGLLMLVAIGCTTAKSDIAQADPHFSWEPPAKEPPTKINIALINPEIKESKLGSYRGDKYVDLFRSSLATDLNKTLLAKGFTVAEFGSLDEMTFPQKKASPLALYPDVMIVFDESYQIDSNEPGALGSHMIRKRGTLTATTQVKFAVIEPMSGQKIWLKKVDIAPQTVRIEVERLENAQGELNPYHSNRDNRGAVVVDVLNKAYPEIMQKFWSYLNAEEIQAMKKAADDLRARKVY